MTQPPATWPTATIPLPVRFAFDPAGALYFELQSMPEEGRERRYIDTARELFLPRLPVLNGAGLNLRGRTPEAYTLLPELDDVEEEVRRWLA